jgi:D-glycero-D-manno-heptose 1,7-bisphosphate phosphatase
MRRAVFLDRDGTINAMVYDPDHGLVDSPARPDQFQLLPGVGEAIRRINQADFLAVVVSNQPGIAKRRFTLALLDAVTEKMHQELARFGARLDAVYYCLHHPEAVLEEFRAACGCRKPKPGLILEAARALQTDLGRSFVAGDGITDVQAGAAVGCTTVWLGRYKCDVCQAMHENGARPDYMAGSLLEAVALILGEGGWYADLPGHSQRQGDQTVAR